jgi:hypothetical protein
MVFFFFSFLAGLFLFCFSSLRQFSPLCFCFSLTFSLSSFLRFVGRYQQKEKESTVNTMFNFYYQDEDASFQLVDNTKVQTKKFTRRFPNRPFQQTTRAQGQQKPRNPKFNRLGSTNQWRGSRFQEATAKKKEFSIEVKPDWKLIEEIEFNKLSKLAADAEPTPTDLFEFFFFFSFSFFQFFSIFLLSSPFFSQIDLWNCGVLQPSVRLGVEQERKTN